MEERLIQLIYAEGDWIGTNRGDNKDNGDVILLTTTQKRVEDWRGEEEHDASSPMILPYPKNASFVLRNRKRRHPNRFGGTLNRWVGGKPAESRKALTDLHGQTDTDASFGGNIYGFSWHDLSPQMTKWVRNYLDGRYLSSA